MTIHGSASAPSPESDEQYVRDVIDSAMSGTRAPVDLPSSALARGRRLRIRRRLAAASCIAAVGLLAAGAAPWLAASTGNDPRGRSDDLVATQPPDPVPSMPTGWWDMPATEMVSTVEAILPDGITVSAPGPLEADTDEGGPATGWISPLLQASTGPGRLNVILSPGPGPTGPVGTDVEISCAEEFFGRTECVQLQDGQGSVIGRRLTNWRGGTVLREVVLRRDGGTVYAASANTLDGKWGADSPLSAELPPMTLDQLEDLVRNDAWTSYRP